MQEREALVMLEQQLRCQTVQVNKTSQVIHQSSNIEYHNNALKQIAQEVYIEGQEALKTAQKLQEDVKYKMIILRKEQESLLMNVCMHSMNDTSPTTLHTGSI